MLGAIGFGSSLIGSLGAGVGAFLDSRRAKKIKPVHTPYQVSPYAKNTLGLAQQMLGAKSAAVQQAEAGINQNAANAMYGAQQGATDSSQLLAMGSAVQGQANQAVSQLAPLQQQFQMQQQQNVAAANAGMTNELGKVYEDMMRKYQIDLQTKIGYQDAAKAGLGQMAAGLTSTAGAARWGGFGETIKNLFKK